MVDRPALSAAIDQIRAEALRLTDEELANTGDKAERSRQAQALNARLDELRPAVDRVPPDDRSAVDDAWRAAQRYLIFLLATSEVEPNDPAQIAQQLSHDAFALAKEAVVGIGDRVDREHKARALLARLDEVLPRVDKSQPDNQRALTDATLDLYYILQAGAGVTSLRLAHFVREQRR